MTTWRAILRVYLVVSWALASLTCATSWCQASWLPNGTPVCNVAAYDVLEGVMVDGNQVVFAWSSSRSGELKDGEIRVRRMYLDGTPVPGWPEFGLRVSESAFWTTSVCPDGAGGVIAVWSDLVGSLRAQRMNRTGAIASGWPSDGVFISTTLNGSAILPDNNGGALVAWIDDHYGSRDANVYIQRVSSLGVISSGWPSAGVPVCVAEGNQGQIHLASDGEDGAFVAWMDERSGSGRVYASRITGSGDLAPGWAANGVPASADSSDQGNVQIVEDGSGGLFLAWDDWTPPTALCCFRNVYAQHLSGDASPKPGWSPLGVRVCDSNDGQELNSMVTDSSGGAFIVWRDSRANTSSENEDIYAARLTSGGPLAPGWPADGLPVCTKPGSQWPESMAPDGTGGFWVTWVEALSHIYGTREYNPYVQHVTSDGTLLASSGGTALCTARDFQGNTQIATVPGGGAVVAWNDGRTYRYAGNVLAWGDSDIFATLVSDAGTPSAAAGAPITMRFVRPNPSPGRSEILFDLESDATVTCRIFDALGRKVRALLDAEPFTAGAHRALWDGKDDQGRHTPSGVYFIRVESAGGSETRRLVRVRQ